MTCSKGEKMVIEFLFWGEPLKLCLTVQNSVANNGKSYWSYCKGATGHVCWSIKGLQWKHFTHNCCVKQVSKT